MIGRVLLSLLVGVHGLCPTAQAGGTDHSYDPLFSCNEGPYSLPYGTKLSAYARLGKPSSASAARENGVLIVTQQYKSFVAHFEVDDKDTSGLLSALITEDPKAPVVRLVTVGMPVSKLPTALRERYIPEVEVIEVCGDTDCGKFHIRNGRVARIKYECYTG
ncbi:MAG: hypothetical protein ABIG35_11880 [Pseudomonadota bacterium]